MNIKAVTAMLRAKYRSTDITVISLVSHNSWRLWNSIVARIQMATRLEMGLELQPPLPQSGLRASTESIVVLNFKNSLPDS